MFIITRTGLTRVGLNGLLLFLFFFAYSGSIFAETRSDGAVKVGVSDSAYHGSLQNGAWSPGNKYLMVTNWEDKYNEGPANILIVDLSNYSIHGLTSDGKANVNMPGSTWNRHTHRVVFSSGSNGGDDQVHIMDPNGEPGEAIRVTKRDNPKCWEPGFSPDGKWVVYEAHYDDNFEHGVIEIYEIGSTRDPITLTSAQQDCRQPSWSPSGDKILYQRYEGNSWNIWTMDIDGSNPRNVTGDDPGDKTDASFSPDGKWIVYSSCNGELRFANIYIKRLVDGKTIRATHYSGYDGAPSWSTDDRIVFESSPGAPDGSAGTTLWIIDAPIKTEIIPPRNLRVVPHI